MLSAFKNGIIAFLIASLLFGTVGFFATNYVSGLVTEILDGEKHNLNNIINPSDDENNESTETKPNDKVPEGESFTALFIGTDYRPDIFDDYCVTEDDRKDLISSYDQQLGLLEADIRTVKATWIVLLRADKEEREFVSVYISPQTAVETPAGTATLGDVYGRYGVNTLCDHITAITGLGIDYNFIIDGERGIDFYNSMGSVSFELDVNIFSDGSKHISNETSVQTVVPDTTESPDENTEPSEDDKNKQTTDDKNDSDADPEEAVDNEDKDDENEDEDKEDTTETTEFETEIAVNVLVLPQGMQSLSDYSVHILNSFVETSEKDIDVKSSYIFEMFKQYIERCSMWSVAEFTYKYNELTMLEDGNEEVNEYLPYDTKPIIATNLEESDISSVHSMLQALEYFDYKEIKLPGTFSTESGMFIPDKQDSLDLLKIYR